MSARFIVAGTDTDVGKTVFSAGLVRWLDGMYWKPVQAGLDGETDTDVVRRLAALPPERVLPEAYRLRTPASPHWAAELDGITIDAARLAPAPTERPLIIETAGGLLVPLTRSLLQIDAIATWRAPVILCARTRLGTLNHTFLSLEALRARKIPVLGIALIGAEHPDNARTLAELAGTKLLGRLPPLEPLDAPSLAAAFSANFARSDFKPTHPTSAKAYC
jgi:dethiobiotin synthetase